MPRAWTSVLIACLIVALWPALAWAADEPAAESILYLSSSDWPPYTREVAPHGGSEAVVRAALATMGVRLQTDYFPWRRAVTLGQSPGKYAGYYTEYQSEGLSSCLYSDRIGTSRIGLAERKDSGLYGRTLDQLGGVVIGTVLSYVNTPEFDNRVKDGKIKVEGVVDDLTNLRKLVVGRFPAAVIDKSVMDYLMGIDHPLVDKRDILLFDDTAFEQLTLHVCFRNDDAGRYWVQILNEGLKRIDVDAINKAGIDQAMH